jgi:hypothetical protein
VEGNEQGLKKPVFSFLQVKQRPLARIDMPRKDFEFFQIFMTFFVFTIDSVSSPENGVLSVRTFFKLESDVTHSSFD